MVPLHDPADLNRAYYGTDTRATPSSPASPSPPPASGATPRPTPHASRSSSAPRLVPVLALMWTRLDAQSEPSTVGGFAVAGAAAALVPRRRPNPRRGPISWLLSLPARSAGSASSATASTSGTGPSTSSSTPTAPDSPAGDSSPPNRVAIAIAYRVLPPRRTPHPARHHPPPPTTRLVPASPAPSPPSCILATAGATAVPLPATTPAAPRRAGCSSSATPSPARSCRAWIARLRRDERRRERMSPGARPRCRHWSRPALQQLPACGSARSRRCARTSSCSSRAVRALERPSARVRRPGCGPGPIHWANYYLKTRSSRP